MEDPTLKSKSSILVLKLEDIKPNVEGKVREYGDLFGLDADRMYLVAKYYRWNQERMQSEWFENESTLKYALGLYPDPAVAKDKSTSVSLAKNLKDGLCLICYEDVT
jgi:hypothetical protein